MRPTVLLAASIIVFSLSLNAQSSRTYSRILFVGNSITRCPSDSTIEWYGTWGMAASSPQNDYVHRVISSLTARQGPSPSYAIQSASQFERFFMKLDLQLWLSSLDTLHPDLVVFQLGENIRPDTALRYDLGSMYRILLETAKAKAQNARIIVLSTFWATRSIDSMICYAALSANVSYLDISLIYKDTLNRATSERHFKDRDVGSHPGDRGMDHIAQIILDATATGVEEGNEESLPGRFGLDVFPNPFNGTSVVQLTLPNRVPVCLRVVDLLGEEVLRYSTGDLEAGTHRLPISLSRLPTGTYIIKAQLGNTSLHKKAMLIR
jgi:hypothetical protein